MLSVVYYLVNRGTALYRFESWSIAHMHPFGQALSGQDISNLLLSQSEDARQSFLKDWCKSAVEKECLCYDLTSVSSYARHNEYVEYGYNRDKEDLPQINLAMLLGQESKLPIYYKRLSGSIADVSTLSGLLKTMRFLDYGRLHLVLDKGFYSEDNINDLFSGSHKFTIGVPTHLKWIQSIIDEHRDRIELPDNYHKVHDETLYIQSKLHPWGEKRKRSYVHLYYNAHRAAASYDNFMAKLIACKHELETGARAKGNELFYERYFLVKKTPVRGLSVEYNHESILKYRKRYAGFFALFTNDFKDPVITLETYRNKDVVENCFDDLKNQLDMKRLRVHLSPSMDARLFLQFIALVYISVLRKRLKNASQKDFEYLSARELLEYMETYVKVTYEGRYGAVYTELTKRQRLILEALGVSVET